MQTRLRWLVLALCGLVAATPVAAQETGSISGYTFDATGTAVAGVSITVTERCSGHDGTYAFRLETRDQSLCLGRAARAIDAFDHDEGAARRARGQRAPFF